MRAVGTVFALVFWLSVPPLGADWRNEPFAASPTELRQAFAAIEDTGSRTTVTLYREVRYRIDKKHRRIRYERKIYRIESQAAGAIASLVQAAWQPWIQNRPRVRARVIAPDNQVHYFDPETFTESSPVPFGSPIFSDLKLLQAPLPAAEPGAIVEVEAEIEDHSAIFDAGLAEAVQLIYLGPTIETRVQVDVPAQLAFQWRTAGLPNMRSAPRTAGIDVTFGRIGPATPSEWLQFAQQAPDKRPRLMFSTGRSWGAVAAGYSRMVEKQLGPVPGAWPEAGESVHETVAAVLARVHDRVRYASVALGLASIVPRSPAETLERRYGDCKDKSTLLMALLRERGVPAEMALLNASRGPDVDPDLPGFGLFDHAIVYVPGEQALWIDPTQPYARAGELPVADQGRWALIVSERTTELVKTPAARSTANRFLSVRTRKLSERGEGVMIDDMRTWGELEREARTRNADMDAERLGKQLNSAAARRQRGMKMQVLDLTPSDELSQPFHQVIESTFPDYLLTGRSQISVTANGAGTVLQRIPIQPNLKSAGPNGGDPSKASGDDQPLPLSLLFAYSGEARVRLIPPAGFRLRRMPQPREADLGPATLEEEFRLEDDGSVVLITRFDSKQSRFDPEDARQLRAGVLKLRKRGGLKIEFDNVAELHLRAGRVREAIAECRRVLRLDPDNGPQRLRLVNAYLAAGAGLEARREAREAVARTPDDALSHYTLGWALSHDEIGRKYAQGMDVPGAEAAYRRSSEISGTLGSAAVRLKELLTFSPNGVRYADPARVDSALELARRLAEKNDSSAARSNHSNLLAKTGRYQELLDFLQESEIKGSLVNRLIEAVAVVEGPDAALGRAFEHGGGESQIASVARRLASARRYPAAAKLYEAAARGFQASSRSTAGDLERADLYHRVKRHEDLDLDPLDPKTAVMRWVIALFSAESWRDAIKPLVSRYGKSELRSEAEGHAFDRWIERIRYSKYPEQSYFAQRADEVLAQAQYQVDGDDQNGYRIRVNWPQVYGQYVTVELAFFVLREGDGYRVLDTTEGESVYLADLGAAALDRVERGDIDGARILLDWSLDAARADWGDFRTLWSQSAERSAAPARAAAAALMAVDPTRAQQAIEILLASPASSADADGGVARELRLMDAYEAVGQFEAALDGARKRLARDTEDNGAVRDVARLLSKMDRREEAIAVYDARIADRTDDTLLDVRMARATLAGDLDACYRLLERLEELGAQGSAPWNNLAWTSLVHGQVDERSKAAIDRAARLAAGRSPSVLNTQAAIYAVLGQPETARKMMLQAMELGRRQKPAPEDWLAAGFIAEAYGLTDTAGFAFRRAGEPAAAYRSYDSAGEVARRRLQELDAKP